MTWTVLVTLWRRKFRKKVAKFDNNWHDICTDSLINFETVKYFTNEEYEMKRFVEGLTDIMVATTVIEVGVNVPNASVMVIESAERFGLSQLHQLRGRVGRGAEQSYCVLMSGNKVSNEGKERLKTMVETSDGFKISEVDLRLRGAGDMMGTKQSGSLQFQIADLVKDTNILEYARKVAIKLLEEDENLEKEENKNILRTYLPYAKQRNNWSRIS